MTIRFVERSLGVSVAGQRHVPFAPDHVPVNAGLGGGGLWRGPGPRSAQKAPKRGAGLGSGRGRGVVSVPFAKGRRLLVLDFVYTIEYGRQVTGPFLFEWDDANTEHIARHNFTAEEVEEVFEGSFRIRRVGTSRYTALGQTLDGRLAFVVFERRQRRVIRVITARDMDNKERRQYHRK